MPTNIIDPMTQNIPNKLVIFAIDHTARTFREEDKLVRSLMKKIDNVSNSLAYIKGSILLKHPFLQQSLTDSLWRRDFSVLTNESVPGNTSFLGFSKLNQNSIRKAEIHTGPYFRKKCWEFLI